MTWVINEPVRGPFMIPLPLALSGAGVTVALAADAGTAAAGVSDGPLYTMIGVIVVAVCGVISAVAVNRKRTYAETPDVTMALTTMSGQIGAVRQMIEDDRKDAAEVKTALTSALANQDKVNQSILSKLAHLGGSDA